MTSTMVQITVQPYTLSQAPLVTAHGTMERRCEPIPFLF